MPLLGMMTRRVVVTSTRGLLVRRPHQQRQLNNEMRSTCPSISAVRDILSPITTTSSSNKNNNHSRFFTTASPMGTKSSTTPQEEESPAPPISSSTKRTTPLDYYAVLGVERGFSMDTQALKQSYRTLMTQHHPDLQHHIPNNNNKNHDYASTITHAYHTLRKPHTRAMHLLRLVGKPIDGDEEDRHDDDDNATAPRRRMPPATLVGPEFLMHIMEWRERIDGIPALSDFGGSTKGTNIDNDIDIDIDNNEDKNNDVLQELKERLQETRQEMESILTQLDQVYVENEELDHKAMSLVAQLQYWHRIEETIVEKM